MYHDSREDELKKLDEEDPKYIQIGPDSFQVKHVRCGECGTPVYNFTRCRRCDHYTCGSDACYEKAPVYECDGWHTFSEDACELCRDKEYSKVVDGKYFCPECCPDPTEKKEYKVYEDEYRLKVMAVNVCDNLHKEFQSIRPNTCRFFEMIPTSFLNDPKQWKRCREDPVGMEQELKTKFLRGKSTIEDYISLLESENKL